jgi:catechol 2,3-dioxygenase-like lactoylglutathione lyase family enzyme
MPTGIDHIVIAVTDPDAAADELSSSLGLAFTAGGRHPGGGTFNRIAFAGDAYLELIGVEDRSLAEQNAIGRAAVAALDAGGGFATYALVEDDLEQQVLELQAAGSGIGPPERGSRRRPDGTEVIWWRSAFEHLGPDQPPFLIRHDPTAAEWDTHARAERAAFRHPIGSPAILVRLDIATPDPPGLAAIYPRQVGLEFWAVADLAVCTVGQHTIRLRPSSEMHVPAVVVIGADVPAPRSVIALGMQFDVEPVELPAAWLEQGAKGTTPLPGDEGP